MSASAELLADGGAAAADGEFFRSREFAAAEGVTHSLRLRGDGGEMAAPLVVRPVAAAAEARDASSPYGYPGLRGTAAPPLDPAAVDWSGCGLVSVFVRHALGEPPLAGATARNRVQVADPELPRKSRASDRQQIRRAARGGLTVEVLAGAEAGAGHRAGFLAAYTETMRRTDAAARYFFDARYFDHVLAHPRTRLLLALREGEVAAGSIAVESDGFLHYYLSGTGDVHLRDSPMKSVVSRMVDLAIEAGLPLNLGGGISRGDALEEFKRGFANRELDFHTSEIVCDRAAYERLSAGRDPGGFFPAYRAPRPS